MEKFRTKYGKKFTKQLNLKNYIKSNFAIEGDYTDAAYEESRRENDNKGIITGALSYPGITFEDENIRSMRLARKAHAEIQDKMGRIRKK